MVFRRPTNVTMLFGLALALIGVAGCVESKYPLSDSDDTYIDLYLPGIWKASKISDNGDVEFEDIGLDFEATVQDGGLQLSVMDAEAQMIFSAQSTRIGANKYLSVRCLKCTNCADEDREICDENNEFPYQIIKYQTFVPKSLPHLEVLEDKEELRGRLLFFTLMNGDAVCDAIDAGVLDGENYCSGGPFGHSASMGASSVSMREFLSVNDAAAFPGLDWPFYIRSSSQ